MPNVILGMDAKLYYGNAGSSATNEMTNVRDVTVSAEAGEADVTTRANSGWRATVATLRECSIEFEMVWDPADAGFTRQKAVPFAWARGVIRGRRSDPSAGSLLPPHDH